MWKRFSYATSIILLAVFIGCLPSFLPAGEIVHPHDTSMQVVFSFGHGPRAVRDIQFVQFARDVIAPTLGGGATLVESKGQRLHPDRGIIREQSVVLLCQYVSSQEMDDLFEELARQFLARYPGSNASVHMTRSSFIESRTYSQGY